MFGSPFNDNRIVSDLCSKAANVAREKPTGASVLASLMFGRKSSRMYTIKCIVWRWIIGILGVYHMRIDDGALATLNALTIEIPNQKLPLRKFWCTIN
jgi:hypothetical protein